MNTELVELLGLQGGGAVAFVGCGGKTSLIMLLSKLFPEKKVLISPTTKIFPPETDGVILCDTLNACRTHTPETGVQCLGVKNAASGKLEALPRQILAEMMPLYDVVLLEADGSRGFYLKGWQADEPVIPDACTHTVGVVTAKAIGLPATGEHVFRLSEFMALTGLSEGSPVTAEALSSMALSKNGMFKNSVGHKVLLVNQAEGDEGAAKARRFLQCIKKKAPARFDALLFGSVHQNVWRKE